MSLLSLNIISFISLSILVERSVFSGFMSSWFIVISVLVETVACVKRIAHFCSPSIGSNFRLPVVVTKHRLVSLQIDTSFRRKSFDHQEP